MHSIGSAHVIGWMLAQPRLREHFAGREEMIQVLRLAALLHDLGHLPFSHLGELVYGAVEGGGLELIEAGEQTAFDVAAGTTAYRAHHEELTGRLIESSPVGARIDEALGDIDGENASTLVRAVIDGSYPDPLCQALVSSDVDCDRLDYLLRDSLAVGLPYGQIDLAYLIENLVIGR